MQRHADPNASVPTPEPGVGAPDGALTAAPRPDDPAITMTLPAEQRYIRMARLVAAGLANELGFDVDRLDDVRLAVGEACGLAVHEGATSLALRYVLGEHTLDVTIDAPVDAGAASSLDLDLRALVEQVLEAASASHHLGGGDGRLSVRLTFNDGH